MRLRTLRTFCASMASTPSLHELEKSACPFLKALYFQLRAEITTINRWFYDGRDRMVGWYPLCLFCAQPAQLCLVGLNAHCLCLPRLPPSGSFQRRVHLGYVKVLSCPVQETLLKRAQLEYRFSSSHRISPRVDVVPCREIQRE